MEANRVALKRTVHQRSSGLCARIIGIYTILILVTLTAWFWAELEFHQQPVFLGTVLLAYSFGLRHAADADDIAAIDNVTRKLMQEGKLTVGAGFWFAMGHSAVVVLATAVIAAATSRMQERFEALRRAGGIISTGCLRPVSVCHCDNKPAHPPLRLAHPQSLP